MSAATALNAFEALVARRPLPLLQAAVEAGRYLDAEAEPGALVDTVRGWGARLAARIPADMSPLNRLRQLNHFFFNELGFRPNTDRYDDVENSLLARVVEQRTGIPITLALLYVEVGRAAGLALQGVGFPGHFLVRLSLNDGAMFLDVFASGTALSLDNLQARLAAALEGAVEYPLEVYLRPASEREILARLLRNLKRIHLRAGDAAAALQAQHRLVAVRPEAPEERRARAGLYERLECPRAAAQDLSAYLSMSPDPQDAQVAWQRLHALQQAADRLN